MSEELLFLADVKLLKHTKHSASELEFAHFNIKHATIGSRDAAFNHCIFSGIKFDGCNLNQDFITNCIFINCEFIDSGETQLLDNEYYGCQGLTNYVIQEIDGSQNIESSHSIDEKIQILLKYFKSDGQTTRVVRISNLKKDSSDEKETIRAIDSLESLGLIKIYGDKSYINAKGLQYLKSHRNG